MAPSMPVRCTLLVIAILFAGIFAGCLSVRKRFAARTGQNPEALQVSLLQNTYIIPTQIQETTLPIPVFAPEDGCLLYLFWELLQSGEI